MKVNNAESTFEYVEDPSEYPVLINAEVYSYHKFHRE